MIKLKLHYEENADRDEPLIYADDLKNYLDDEIRKYRKWYEENHDLHFENEVQLLMRIKFNVIQAIESLNRRETNVD